VSENVRSPAIMPAEAQNVPLHPSVLWAQRDVLVYLTISVEDMKIEDLSVNEKSLHIKGESGVTHQQYECTLEFSRGERHRLSTYFEQPSRRTGHP